MSFSLRTRQLGLTSFRWPNESPGKPWLAWDSPNSSETLDTSHHMRSRVLFYVILCYTIHVYTRCMMLCCNWSWSHAKLYNVQNGPGGPWAHCLWWYLQPTSQLLFGVASCEPGTCHDIPQSPEGHRWWYLCILCLYVFCGGFWLFMIVPPGYAMLWIRIFI